MRFFSLRAYVDLLITMSLKPSELNADTLKIQKYLVSFSSVLPFKNLFCTDEC